MHTAGQSRPNILFILADDMGYSDIGCFGGEIATPALDALALRGVRQTQFYNCARCCPTRASLLTGLYPHRAGVGRMVTDEHRPAYRGFLSSDAPTIAERLRDQGYSTWMSGKWHCGGEYPPHRPDVWSHAGDPTHPLPTQRGFDRYYGVLLGACSYFNPSALVDQDRIVSTHELPDDYYLTDELGRRAADFVSNVTSSDTPWFGYLAFTAPHWPLHARTEDVDAYRDVYRCGWDVLRRQRLERLIGLGLLAKDHGLSPRDMDSHPWADEPHQAWQVERMAVYAAQVTAMDRAIGRVISAVDASGQLDDTLVVFCSDNGGCAEFLREDGPSTVWPGFYGIPTKRGAPCIVGDSPQRLPGPETTFMSYGLPWANASNTPFRKFKAWVHEGGISTPLIASWPERLPCNEIRTHTGHVMDLASTACSAAGVSAPGSDGMDLLPAWRGMDRLEDRSLFWEHYGYAAVRAGRWKLVRAGADRAWELYDMSCDRIESVDLASARAALVTSLSASWERWAREVGVD